jgi:hypothetical protein
MLEVCGVSELLVIPVHALEPVIQYWIVVTYGTEIAFLSCIRSVNSLKVRCDSQSAVHRQYRSGSRWHTGERPTQSSVY